MSMLLAGAGIALVSVFIGFIFGMASKKVIAAEEPMRYIPLPDVHHKGSEDGWEEQSK